MDACDHERTDREIERRMIAENEIVWGYDRFEDEYFDLVSGDNLEEIDTRPSPIVLVPIGEYNGVDLPNTDIDENYIVWLEIECPECDCKVIMLQ